MEKFNKKSLTAPQRREVIFLQAHKVAQVQGCRRVRVYNELLKKGIVIQQGDRSFRLAGAWQGVDVSFESRGPRGPYQGESEYNPEYIARWKPNEMSIPTSTTRRAPAQYSNTTREQLIDQLLNT